MGPQCEENNEIIAHESSPVQSSFSWRPYAIMKLSHGTVSRCPSAISIRLWHEESMHLIRTDYSIHINHTSYASCSRRTCVARGNIFIFWRNVNQSPWRQSDCSWQPINEWVTAKRLRVDKLTVVRRNVMDGCVRSYVSLEFKESRADKWQAEKWKRRRRKTKSIRSLSTFNFQYKNNNLHSTSVCQQVCWLR